MRKFMSKHSPQLVFIQQLQNAARYRHNRVFFVSAGGERVRNRERYKIEPWFWYIRFLRKFLYYQMKFWICLARNFLCFIKRERNQRAVLSAKIITYGDN